VSCLGHDTVRKQIIGILKEAAADTVVTELCRKHSLSSATYLCVDRH
jgi:hypothetical protein